MLSRISRASHSRAEPSRQLPGSKISQAPPPSSLAARIALWAFSCSWRASAPPPGCTAMPQLAGQEDALISDDEGLGEDVVDAAHEALEVLGAS